MFQVGGVDVLVHKYIGPGSPLPGASSPSMPIYNGTNPFQIQDLLFLENRDRKYDPDIYLLRGVYNMQDIDFNLSQFGLFLQNDTVFITFHINDTVEKLGRKIISGDVIELPHLKDEHALNDLNFALKRFYVVEEVNRAAEGFSVTWYPHLYRAKCKPLVDSQEFKQILDSIANTDGYQGAYDPAQTYYPGDVVDYNGVKYEVTAEVTGIAPPDTNYYKVADSLRDIMSTYNKEMEITNAVLEQAEADAPKSGYDTTTYYTTQVDANGKIELVSVDTDAVLASQQTQATDADGNLLFEADSVTPIMVEPNASTVFQTPENSGYPGYLVGDGEPPNGSPFSAGITFPVAPVKGQYCLRNDYLPKRLFRFDGTRWVKVEDDVRMTLSNNDTRNTYKTGFINNTKNTNLVKLFSDTFFVGNPIEAGDPLINVDVDLGVVTTDRPYNVGYGIEVFVNEVPIESTVSTTNTLYMEFTIKTKLHTGDKVEWVMYERHIKQRQALSKALRPEADL